MRSFPSRPDLERMLSMGANIETVKINEHGAKLTKIELNEHGDYVAISLDSPVLFDNFVAGYKHIVDLSESVPKQIEEIEKKYEGQDGFTAVMEKTVAISKVNVDFSADATKTIDGIFGDGTTRKYFHDIYEEIPDFIPDADCIIDFFEKISPEMEKLFDKKIKERDRLSKARMAKYQPQEHKRKGSK